jgi:hypothetical protein
MNLLHFVSVVQPWIRRLSATISKNPVSRRALKPAAPMRLHPLVRRRHFYFRHCAGFISSSRRGVTSACVFTLFHMQSASARVFPTVAGTFLESVSGTCGVDLHAPPF